MLQYALTYTMRKWSDIYDANIMIPDANVRISDLARFDIPINYKESELPWRLSVVVV